MLKGLLNTAIALALSLQSFAAYGSSGTPENTVTNQAFRDLKAHKSWDSFLKASKPRVSAPMYAFIKSKVDQLRKTKPPKLVMVSGTTLRVQSKHGAATVQIVDAGEKKFFINNRPVSITAADTPQSVWDKVEATFPKPAAQRGVSSWLLPSAHADFGLTFFIGLGVTITVMTVVGLVIGFNSCGEIDSKARECEAVAADKSASRETMNDAFLRSQSAVNEMRVHLGCDAEKKRIDTCFKTMQMRTLPAQGHPGTSSEGVK